MQLADVCDTIKKIIQITYYFPSLSFLYPSYLNLANCSIFYVSSQIKHGQNQYIIIKVFVFDYNIEVVGDIVRTSVQ